MQKETAVEKAILQTRRGNFRRALSIFEEDGCHRDDPLATSYYALALSVVRKEYEGALSLSIWAAKKEFYNPEIYLNIGKICLLMGRKDLAFRAFKKGLRIDKTHKGIISQLKKLGIRRAPAIPQLPRRHILNKIVGRLIHELKKIRRGTHPQGGSGADF
ncbi:MAG: hypothetical protein HY883_07475 [Deltaproteobacteria bacterium]|nr:hypothetical protein [Deltaproteobacteria bacterium]